MKLHKVLLVVLVAIAASSAWGCDDEEGCPACAGEGCVTLDQALDAWLTLIQDCSCFNPQEDREGWAARWAGVPPALVNACATSIMCDKTPHTCGESEDPLSWGDPDGLEACMRRFVDFGQTACYGDRLNITHDMLGCISVDCNDYCGTEGGGCVTGESASDCGCGFVK